MTVKLFKFAKDNKGNVATMAALLMLPLMGAMGAAVDYSRISSARGSLQVAVDSAALAAASHGGRVSDMQWVAANMVETNYGHEPDLVKTTVGNHKLVVRAQDRVQTPILAVLGSGAVEIEADATVKSSLPLRKSSVSTDLADPGLMKKRMETQLMRLKQVTRKMPVSQRRKLEQAIRKEYKKLVKQKRQQSSTQLSLID